MDKKNVTAKKPNSKRLAILDKKAIVQIIGEGKLFASVKAGRQQTWDVMKNRLHELKPLADIPAVDDIVYHDNKGVVEYRVESHIDEDAVLLETVKDFGNGWFEKGHMSIRDWQDLCYAQKLKLELGEADY